MDILGGMLVTVLFIVYSALWKIKRYSMVKLTGVDPEVFNKSGSNLQIYMGRVLIVVTLYAVALIILHTLNFQFHSMFARYSPLDHSYIKFTGFFIGVAGLCLCLYAQIKMGKSWRVGIDESVKTDLITTGLYKSIRNPTYLGLYILNAGVWLIWPTWAIFILNLIFIYTLEIQVRCEEDYLEKTYGDVYISYKKRTKRYFPYLY